MSKKRNWASSFKREVRGRERVLEGDQWDLGSKLSVRQGGVEEEGSYPQEAFPEGRGGQRNREGETPV